MANEVNTTEPKRDVNMDLQSLMTRTNPTTTEEKKESALDRAIRTKQTGIVVSNDEIREGEKELEPLKPARMTEERDQEFNEKVDELNDLNEKAKAIKVTNRPTNGVEMASLIDELTETKIGADGKAIVPEGSKHIRARTDADGEAGTEQSLNSENEMDENPSESQLSEEEKKKIENT